MKLRKTLTLLVLAIISCLLLQGSVQAALQSVPSGTTKSDTATNWIINVRKMENAGGGMGLKETTNETSGLATSESNNIDVHLLKNTEYGAIVLLGASDYGKQGTDIEARRMDYGATTGTEPQASTTGNKYGVYELGYSNMTADSNNAMYEWTAAGGPSFLANIAPRYIDRYSYYNSQNSYEAVKDKADAKPGDATIETAFWHSDGPYFYWLNGADLGFIRGSATALRGVFHTDCNAATSRINARAAVVCGVGL